MIEPTDEMYECFAYAGDIPEGVAAVLALVERDYVVRPRPAKPRERRVGRVDHDPVKLRRARKTAGWRQCHLATYVAVSASLLCEAEKGTRGLAPDVLLRIAATLGVPVAALHPAGWS